jgi:TDG/mug DNA glycosylase family protein
MDRDTVRVYETRGAEWASRRRGVFRAEAAALGRRVPPDAVRIDVGCGHGVYLTDLGAPVVAFDAARVMLELARAAAPAAWVVQGDLEALPFRPGAFGAAWARASYVHVPRDRLPLALAQLQRASAPGAPVTLVLHRGDVAWGELPADDFAGRRFGQWEPDALADVVVGAGFELDGLDAGDQWITVTARRGRLLPDTVGPGMRLLVCGLNPSLYTADAGVGYARPGNRFWPAALASGLVSRDRDPLAALADHGVGMTNLVLRATPRADQITPAEYRAGAARVERLVRWLRPGALCVVGVTGWRHAVDRKAELGEQPARFGGRPVYVMPNTSGLNAHAKPADYERHLRAAWDLACRRGAPAGPHDPRRQAATRD